MSNEMTAAHNKMFGIQPELKDDDMMVQIVITLRRDGSMMCHWNKETDVSPPLAGILSRGMLAHAQAVLETKKA